MYSSKFYVLGSLSMLDIRVVLAAKPLYSEYDCSGSGSEFQNVEIYRCFIPVFRIRIRQIRMVLASWPSVKNYVNVPLKSNEQKNFFLNKFFVGVLKVSDENSRIRIRIRIRIHWSEARIRGSGSTPKCYEIATLFYS
jgi:hypothetical protein